MDKGGAVVITNVDEYIREANWQLSKIYFYKKIPNDPTESNTNKVNNTINELKLQRLLDEKGHTRSSKPSSKKLSFYMLPKIKKWKSREVSH